MICYLLVSIRSYWGRGILTLESIWLDKNLCSVERVIKIIILYEKDEFDENILF